MVRPVGELLRRRGATERDGAFPHYEAEVHASGPELGDVRERTQIGALVHGRGRRRRRAPGAAQDFRAFGHSRECRRPAGIFQDETALSPSLSDPYDRAVPIHIHRDVARSVGLDPNALERIGEIFERQLATELHPGAQLTVRRRGEVVFEAAGGTARPGEPRAVAADTLFLVFSATKPLTAMAIHLLAERGALELESPVARYWPEFGCLGKETATLLHVLSHQGGFPLGPKWLTWDRWCDREAIAKAMVERRVRWEPGTDVGYHPLNFGWVLAEVVRRVDGRSLGRFVAEEIVAPLGLTDTWIGLPPEHDARVAHHRDMSGEYAFVADFNRPEVHAAEVGAAGGITTTRDLSRFYACLVAGGEIDGRRVFRPETVARATRVVIDGKRDRTLEVPMRWALGFHLGGPVSAFGRRSSPEAFGHTGQGSTTAWAEPGLDLAIAYFTNGVRASIDNYLRMTRINDAILAACGREP
jgi:CubicO group peptidase (beta-lactamase class C family)